MSETVAASRSFDDGQRVASLHRIGILDTPPEARFDRLVRLAAHLLDAPSALVSLIESDRQWFKARHNWDGPGGERRDSICDYTIRQRDVMTVPDTKADPRFASLPYVAGAPHVRFYAGSPIHAPDGQPVGSLCVVDFAPRPSLSDEQRWLLQMLADIVSDEITLTTSLQNEERERQRLRDAAEAVPNGFILVDAKGDVAFVNRGYRRMFAEALSDDPEGIPYARLLEQLADTGLVAAAAADRNAWIAASLAQVRQEKASELRLTDGRIILVSNHPTAEGGMVGLRSDITARVRQAEELRSAREAAEAASRARGEFLAVMSHEVRTPLNGVMGMLDALESSRLDPRQSELVAVARQSALALLENLNNLLDLSKLEAGLLHAHNQPFALHPMAADSLALFSGQAQAKGVRILLEIDHDLPEQVVGDAARIRQMLQNLLSNAVKFTARGSVTLALRSCQDKPGWVAFEVSDTGVGIPPGRRDDLFKPYSQLDASYAGKYGGTGLGLSIVKNLAELLGGTIEVRDNEGGGTRFILSLPLPAAAPGVSPERSVPGAAQARILVVDDNETNRLVSRLMLEGLGHNVTLAASGSEAVSIAAEKDFDLILSDIAMDGMDGVALVTAIRAGQGPNRHTPALALTAGLATDDEARCRAAGFLRVLVKPIEKQDLDRAVREAVATDPFEAMLAEVLDALAQDLGAEFIGAFRAAIARDLRKWQGVLAAARASGDARALGSALHGLKGVCATLRLGRLESELRRLEAQGDAAAPAEIADMSARVDRLLALLEQPS